MKERPILFSAPMVRALLAGTKTQTRRVVKPQPMRLSRDGNSMEVDEASMTDGRSLATCRYGQPGSRLWVRESFQPLMADDIDEDDWMSKTDYKTGKGYKVSYPATDGIAEYFDITTDEISQRVTPSIHMPRWASRITLELTGVRIERLQDISEADAVAEGVEPLLVPPDGGSTPYTEGYRKLWEQINGPGSWDANPWVWVLEFRRVSE